MWYKRYYENQFAEYLKPGRVLAIYGARQCGKTSLISRMLDSCNGRYYFGTGDDLPLRDIFKTESVSSIISAFSGYDLIVIDEAQRIPDVGRGLKIITDHLPDVKILASGSFSFQLSNSIGEPLTGRLRPLMLYPLSVLEIAEEFGGMRIREKLNEYLIYGMYPEVLTISGVAEKKEYLVSLRDSYLFRDILQLENIRNSDKLSDLLRLLAFQIGRQVSLNELSNALGIAKQTVERYLDLLEKAFIIKKVRGFSRNLRNEISKTARYYFYDNGVRNALISNFNELQYRDDIGMLWENFLFMERMKKLDYMKMFTNIYFWRTYDKKEIDLVEERDGFLYGYEFKWKKKKVKAPALWLETYSSSSFEVITEDNYLEFLT